MDITKMNILETKKNIIVHQVNELGIMGAGLALQIKNKYPIVFEKYRKIANKDCIGKIQLIKIGENKYICNMFSQKGISRYKQTTDYEAMKKCLQELNKYATEKELSIAFPYKIGCGLAGGNWSTVEKIINDSITCDYEICKL